MKFVYLACPLSPIECETREGNLAAVKAIYRDLCLKHPDIVFLAPWILNCEVFDETPENRAKGIERNEALISLLATYEFNPPRIYPVNPSRPPIVSPTGYGRAALWLCGSRMSIGMRAEADYAQTVGLPVVDLIDRVP